MEVHPAMAGIDLKTESVIISRLYKSWIDPKNGSVLAFVRVDGNQKERKRNIFLFEIDNKNLTCKSFVRFEISLSSL